LELAARKLTASKVERRLLKTDSFNHNRLLEIDSFKCSRLFGNNSFNQSEQAIVN
jgi:hypothetical protein